MPTAADRPADVLVDTGVAAADEHRRPLMTRDRRAVPTHRAPDVDVELLR